MLTQRFYIFINVENKKIRNFLTGAGVLLFLGGGVRFYRVMRTHTEDHFFAPHLLLASLSLFIAWKVLKIGLQKGKQTRKDAISLIRSGSILMMIWSYRLFLLLTQTTSAGGMAISRALAMLYAVMGTAVMCVGLSISRSLRIHNGD
ncbi:MAG: hypothetical protein HY037_07845 [Nitrospirae bacterium]|nr:hypothetical protein [Candidatus Troglogloeales bacterium]